MWAEERLNRDLYPTLELWRAEMEEPLFKQNNVPSRRVLDEEMRLFRSAQANLTGGG